MNKSWKTYLLWFAQEHIEFRSSEIHSILSAFNINVKFVEQPKSLDPYWIVQFSSEEDVKLLANRSVSLRNCLELWAYDKTVSALHNKLRNYPKHLMDPYFQHNKSFKIEVETFCKHFTQKEKVEKLETFSYLPVKGPVNLKNPDTTFQYIEHYGTNANDSPDLPFYVFFGRWVASGLRQIINKFSLKTRKFIGNTSMDPQLALLMANHAKVRNGDLVLDPFVGSGSLLVAAAEFGAYVLGTDIDYLMLHARTRPTRISQKQREKDESIKANMRQYCLEHKYLDVLVNDFSVPLWRDDWEFDSIITDPPYGIREATSKTGTVRENCTVEEKHLSTHIPAKIKYNISHMYKDLLIFSAKHLKIGGRIVCWFPVFREDYEDSCLPSHPCLKLIANCEQILNRVTSRRLLTFEKTRQPNEDELLNNCSEDIMNFTEKYYDVREETRKERRKRETEVREKKRLEYENRKKNS